MNLKRNTKKTRAFLEFQYLPAHLTIAQNGIGQYHKIENAQCNTVFFGQSWREIVAFCEGVAADPNPESKMRDGANFRAYCAEKGI